MHACRHFECLFLLIQNKYVVSGMTLLVKMVLPYLKKHTVHNGICSIVVVNTSPKAVASIKIMLISCF